MAINIKSSYCYYIIAQGALIVEELVASLVDLVAAVILIAAVVLITLEHW